MSSAGCSGSTQPRSTPSIEYDAVVRRAPTTARRWSTLVTESLRTGVGLRRRLPGADRELANSAGSTAPPTSRPVVDGRVAVISGTAQDVTARKLAETELAETLSQLSATLDSTADGILVVSTDGDHEPQRAVPAACSALPDTLADATRRARRSLRSSCHS